MPFKSEAQRRYLWMKEPSVAKEFASATPKGTKLPYHVAKKNNAHKATVKGLFRGK